MIALLCGQRERKRCCSSARAKARASLRQNLVHLKNVRVLDPVNGTLSDPRTVIVFRGRITGVVPEETAVGDDAVVFDGEGGVLMSALIDMHAHLEAWDAPLYLAAGITTVRDMGNDNGRLLALMADIDAGDLDGPEGLGVRISRGAEPLFRARRLRRRNSSRRAWGGALVRRARLLADQDLQLARSRLGPTRRARGTSAAPACASPDTSRRS